MISEVYDAFRSAGADEDKSRAATQALADYQRDITELKSDSRLIPCLLTFNLTLTVAILWKVFS